MTTCTTTGRNTMPYLHIDGHTPDEAYAKLVEESRAYGPVRGGSDPHTYALNHLVKRAHQIGYADGIAAGQPKQLPTTPGSVIHTHRTGHLVLDDRSWGNADYAASVADVEGGTWTLIYDAGQEQNA